MIRFFWMLLFFGAAGQATMQAQSNKKPDAALFATPKNYIVQYTKNAPRIDGFIDSTEWRQATWSNAFTDIEGAKKPKPPLETKVKMLWTDSFLYIAAYLQDGHVWAKLQNRDDIVYYDNDFEVFIDPRNNTHSYIEIEVNAHNTVFDLFMAKPYRNGSGALIAYDVDRLQTAVQVQGTLNNASDTDSSWTVEMAIPFRALYIGNYWRPPSEGALWRINFSRVHWHTEIKDGAYVKKKNSNGNDLSEENWVWSPQGVINMHFPERWGYLSFTKKDNPPPFVLPYAEKRKPFLWEVYYLQKEYRARHGRYAPTLKLLGINAAEQTIEGKKNTLTMEATRRQFTVYISDSENALAVNEDGLVQTIKLPL